MFETLNCRVDYTVLYNVYEVFLYSGKKYPAELHMVHYNTKEHTKSSLNKSIG